MTYEPFSRGPFPVGVRTASVTVSSDPARALDAELWYPASEAHRGEDLDPDTRDCFAMFAGMPSWPQAAVRDAAPREGRAPLVLFSHGYSSHRRQTTHLCTHLASRGYVVASADHLGNTVVDVMMESMGESGPLARLRAIEGVKRSAAARPGDVLALLAAVLDGACGGLSGHVDGMRIGIAGHSFGGWTALSVPALEVRIRAVVALAPSGGPTPTYPEGDNPLELGIRLDWSRDVPTLLVAADRDSILPLAGMQALAARVRGPLTMVVLRNAEHLHFLDRAEELHELFRMMPSHALYGDLNQRLPPFSELCSEESAAKAVRGAALAHLDAHLAGVEEARRWLAGPMNRYPETASSRAVDDAGGVPP